MGEMTQLLEKGDYIKLSTYDLMNKAADVIKKREEKSRKLGELCGYVFLSEYFNFSRT